MKIIAILVFLTVFSLSNDLKKEHDFHVKQIKKFSTIIANSKILTQSYNECLDFSKNNSLKELEIQKIKAKIKDKENENNFHLFGSYSKELNEDKEQSYNLGIKYEALKNGKYERYSDLKILKNELRIEELLQRINPSDDNQVNTLINEIIYQFNLQKLYFNQVALQYAEIYYEIMKNKYLLNQITYDKLIDIKQYIQTIHFQNTGYNKFNEKFNYRERKCLLEVKDIDINKLLTISDNRNDINEIQRLKIENIENKYDRYRDVNLEFQFRNSKTEDSNSLLTGFSFSMPLYSNNNNIKEVEKRIEIEKLNNFKDTKKDYILRSYYEYQSILSGLNKFYYEFQSNQYEIQKYILMFDEQPSKVLNELIHRIYKAFQIQQKIVEHKENAYVRMLKIFTSLGINNPNEYLIDYDFYFDGNVRSKGLSLYIWEDDFNNNSNDKIATFLKSRSINNVFISFLKKANKSKLIDFIIQYKNTFNIELVFHDNLIKKQFKDFQKFNIKINKQLFVTKDNLSFNYKFFDAIIVNENNFISNLDYHENVILLLDKKTSVKKIKNYYEMFRQKNYIINVSGFKTEMELEYFITSIRKYKKDINIYIDSYNDLMRLK